MADKIKVFALGGLDENGRDSYVVEINDDIFVLDAGISLPDKTFLGVDCLLPNFDYLIKNKNRIRAYIMTHDPDFNVKYTGDKEGALTVRWKLPRQRNFMVSRTGKLLANDRADWVMRLITDKSTQLVPQGFYGANGEELALPPL